MNENLINKKIMNEKSKEISEVNPNEDNIYLLVVFHITYGNFFP